MIGPQSREHARENMLARLASDWSVVRVRSRGRRPIRPSWECPRRAARVGERVRRHHTRERTRAARVREWVRGENMISRASSIRRDSRRSEGDGTVGPRRRKQPREADSNYRPRVGLCGTERIG
eukprot:9183058-Pyramimonas_sp.AAC.1